MIELIEGIQIVPRLRYGEGDNASGGFNSNLRQSTQVRIPGDDTFNRTDLLIIACPLGCDCLESVASLLFYQRLNKCLAIRADITGSNFP